MPNTRVKICGITRPEDAVRAAELGADAIGLNFFDGPRRINLIRAGEILAEILPLVFAVGLIGPGTRLSDPKQASIDTIEYEHFIYNSCDIFQAYAIAQQLWDPLSVLRSFEKARTWPVCRIAARDDLRRIEDFMQHEHGYISSPTAANCDALLLDAASPDAYGGSGRAIDWNWIADARAAGELDGLPPIILAGGLTPDNVAQAIRIVRPYAVDVASGVEVPGKPGIKDPIKVRDFIQAAKGD